MMMMMMPIQMIMLLMLYAKNTLPWSGSKVRESKASLVHSIMHDDDDDNDDDDDDVNAANADNAEKAAADDGGGDDDGGVPAQMLQMRQRLPVPIPSLWPPPSMSSLPLPCSSLASCHP